MEARTDRPKAICSFNFFKVGGITKGGELPEMIKKKEKSGIWHINIVTMEGKLHL